MVWHSSSSSSTSVSSSPSVASMMLAAAVSFNCQDLKTSALRLALALPKEPHHRQQPALPRHRTAHISSPTISNHHNASLPNPQSQRRRQEARHVRRVPPRTRPYPLSPTNTTDPAISVPGALSAPSRKRASSTTVLRRTARTRSPALSARPSSTPSAARGARFCTGACRCLLGMS